MTEPTPDRERERHEVADLIRAHRFQSSRPWPDGSKPEAPDWNPGCSCGEAMYYFEHDLHLADVTLDAFNRLIELP
jgi:hypothetical protein